MLTYGDGLGNINLNELLEQHAQSGKTVTLTAVQPQGRFGAVDFDINNTVTSFNEKGKGKYINAGFMVAEPELFDYLGRNEPLEFAPLETLVNEGNLGVHRHNGFWKCVDTLSDLKILKDIWDTGKASWKIWGEV
jgi:glucose-1-phosphate cytidylyltransferase